LRRGAARAQKTTTRPRRRAPSWTPASPTRQILLSRDLQLDSRAGRSVVEATTVMLPPANAEGGLFRPARAALRSLGRAGVVGFRRRRRRRGAPRPQRLKTGALHRVRRRPRVFVVRDRRRRRHLARGRVHRGPSRTRADLRRRLVKGGFYDDQAVMARVAPSGSRRSRRTSASPWSSHRTPRPTRATTTRAFEKRRGSAGAPRTSSCKSRAWL